MSPAPSSEGLVGPKLLRFHRQHRFQAGKGKP